MQCFNCVCSPKGQIQIQNQPGQENQVRVEKGEENEVEITELENGEQIDFSFCIRSNIPLVLSCAAWQDPSPCRSFLCIFLLLSQAFSEFHFLP